MKGILYMVPSNIKSKLLFLRDKNESAWSKGYDLFPKIINDHQFSKGVEVGCAFGGHMESILIKTKVLYITGVDPYKHYKDYKDPMNMSQEAFDMLYTLTLDRLSRFSTRFSLMRKESVEASRSFDKIDFVYIDANHSYDGCIADIEAWLPTLRSNGIIGGHDYNSKSFPGVTKAVNSMFSSVNYEGKGCWWVKI